jgi:triacylglycerol lipase
MALWHAEKTLLIVLRGTRSFKDALIDLNSEMSPYREESVVCESCRVHKGFYSSFLLTWDKLRNFVAYYKDVFEDYEFKVMGHSLGGSISVFLGLKLRQTYPDIHLQVITMGQPMAGNSQFAEYVDFMMGLDQYDPFYNGDLLRITHKHDPVVKLPISDSYNIILGDRYAHSGNEIFINDTRIDNHEPLLTNVIYCDGDEDYQCASGMRFTRDNRQHLNYFRRMGRCGFGFI